MKKRFSGITLVDKRGSGSFSFGKCFLLLVVLGITFAVGTAAVYSIPKPIRYRLTLEVEDNGTVHTGSGVIESRWYNQIFMKDLANGTPWTVQTRGEAVTVDLGSRGLLFALLTGVERKARGAVGSHKTYFAPDPQQIMLMQFSPVGQGSMTTEILEDISHRRDVVNMPFADLPMLVRFRDINDPLTIEPVNPNDLAASFGPGVKLRSATIAITDEPVTVGIEEKLGWLKSSKGGYLPHNDASSARFVGILHAGMFELK
jgi:hypothetical protein